MFESPLASKDGHQLSAMCACSYTGRPSLRKQAVEAAQQNKRVSQWCTCRLPHSEQAGLERPAVTAWLQRRSGSWREQASAYFTLPAVGHCRRQRRGYPHRQTKEQEGCCGCQEPHSGRQAQRCSPSGLSRTSCCRLCRAGAIHAKPSASTYYCGSQQYQEISAFLIPAYAVSHSL